MIRQFMKCAEIANETGMSESFIRKAVNSMRALPRYRQTDFFGSGKAQAVRFVAVQDYIANHDAIEMGAELPELDRGAREEELGIGSFAVIRPVQMTDEDRNKLAAEVVKMIGARIYAGT